ncbi:MAG: GNAT family N-acetyltransferase [Ignavibacteriales bacterium]
MENEISITFTPAHSEDISLLLELMREFYFIEHLEFDGPAMRNALTQLLGSDIYGSVYIIREGGVPAGYFVITNGYSLEFHGRFILVDELYLRESYRGKGIGKLCLRFIEDLCRERGIGAVRLEVARVNIPARELYRRTGYIDQDRDFLTKWLKQ